MPSWTRFVVFTAVIGTLSALLHRYLWVRLVRDALLPQPWARAVTLGLILFAALLPLSLPVARLLPRQAATPFAALVYTWMGTLFLLVVLVVAGDVLRLALAGSEALVALARHEVAEVDPGRRAFVGRSLAALAAFGALALGGWGIRSVLSPVAVTRLRVPLRRLPEGLDGLTIAQLSDVHIGATIGKGFIEDVVRRTNALTPDVIVITGDLVDGPVDDLRGHAAPLAALRARYGVYFVTGNHEYYAGADEWIPELERLGIRVLRNERVEIGDAGASLDLAGVDDWSAGRFGGGHGPDLTRALAGRDPTRELVLLAHQPRAISEAAEKGVGLQLSGHTHGGQIWPWNFMVRLQQPYVAGLHRHGDAHIYVSRGTGYWGPPMRVGAPAEIAHITLTREG